MSKIVRGGQSGSLDNINSSQGTFRTQISALTDAVRQLGGNPEIGAGAVVNDPLSAPYVLYVNPYTGKDTFVGGNYSTSGDATKRIELQRLECGYTEARPFKTLNRAIIEAGIITAKSFYTSPLTNNDLVSIVVAPGAQTVLNGVGSGSVSEWAATKEPTDAELQAFNPSTTGGILLPRGCSLCGWDLRKTIIRPDAVPAVADETSNASNRRSIFKVTGTGYYFGFTFMDKAGSTASHHLLHCFEFASQSELDEFYTKIRQAFGGTNNTGGLDNALAVTRSSEYEIVGPQPASGSQTINTDTTLSASPYIFNCSIRSNYGLSGVYADGAKTSGFRSMVIAQFTGVSLQRDLSCWQKYDSAASPKWGTTFTNYADYISTDPDNVRMHPSRLSFHIRTVNDAIIQEVSVFAIGQGVHHWTQNGGEITITNSNSNFGSCAAISEGYKDTAFVTDRDWVVGRLRVAANLSDLANNVRKIFLGTVSAITSSSITLVNALGESSTVPGVPDILARDGYTLRNGSYVWVENPLGDDWRSTLTSSAWSSGTPAQINITGALTDENGGAVGTLQSGVSNAVGKRVYVRRLVDIRTPDQRRYSMVVNTTSSSGRTPVRDYAIQVSAEAGVINSYFPASSTILVGSSINIPAQSGSSKSSQIVLRRANASVIWGSGNSYKKGETVRNDDKHYTCIEDNSDVTFDTSKWQESYVHMPSDYNPEDFYKLEAPILTFDNDTSGSESSTTLGYNLSTVWSTDALIQAQYRNATDYRGLHLFLTALGFSSANAHTILTPRPEASRDRDPSVSGDMGGVVPSGAANALANWPVEFRRPSIIRLFGHAWEWAGFLNYTKAIPNYQRELSPQNKFTYYFTNVNGGRVYATGFNEEGYQVSPRGLEDTATGTTLSVEDLGSSDITLEQPTSFEALEVGDLTVSSQLNINGNVSISDVALTTLGATTSKAGIVEIATDDEAISATSQSLVLTPAGLGKWALAKGVSYRSTSNQRIFIGNWDNIAPVSFDSTYRAAYWPAPAGIESSNKPDGYTFRPFASLYDAALWCNEFLGTEQQAELIMKPGYYALNSVVFNCKIYLNGASTGTTTSFTSGLIGNYDINSSGNSIMLYTIPFILPNYGFADTQPFFGSGQGVIFNNDANLRYVHFISFDMTLGASAIPDSVFPYGGSVRTGTVKSSQGNRVKEWVAAFIAFYRSTNALYPAIPPNTISLQNPVIRQLGGTLRLDQCTLGAKGASGEFRPGSVPTEGYIYANDCNLILKGVRIRGNEFWDFTGVVASNIRTWGFCTALIRTDGNVSFTFGGLAVGGTPSVDYNYNSHVNNIFFERTYYGSDERNSGAAPTGATIGANEFNAWGSGENDSTRLNRGPSIAAILYSPSSSTIRANVYDVWRSQDSSNDSFRQGFKGTLGSPQFFTSKPIFAVLSPGAKIQYGYQYADPVFEAGAGTTNFSPAATAVDWADSTVGTTSIGLNTSLNLRSTRWKAGTLYKLGYEISTDNNEVYF